jgi:hypothetical protein
VLNEQYETFYQNYPAHVQMVDNQKPFQREEHLKEKKKI